MNIKNIIVATLALFSAGSYAAQPKVRCKEETIRGVFGEYTQPPLSCNQLILGNGVDAVWEGVPVNTEDGMSNAARLYVKNLTYIEVRDCLTEEKLKKAISPHNGCSGDDELDKYAGCIKSDEISKALLDPHGICIVRTDPYLGLLSRVTVFGLSQKTCEQSKIRIENELNTCSSKYRLA